MATIKNKNNISFLFLLIIILYFIFFPIPVITADINIEEKNKDLTFTNIEKNKTKYNIKKIGYHTITAYNSEVSQCDNSPCITANGFNVCEHGIEDTVAVNFLKFGSKIRIPEFFGDKIFIVRDRMNKRNNKKFDIWMINKQDALKFGVKKAVIEILE